MWVISKARMGFTTNEYYGITNIAYDPETNAYTLTDADDNTTTIDGNAYYIFIVINPNY